MQKMAFGSIGHNYNYKNDLAYTEDNVLIHNIFVYNIPSETTEEETLKYFSSFGKVESVRLVADKRISGSIPDFALKVGRIHYTDATSAASVLKQVTPHILNSKRIYVNACDSWQQPFGSLTDDSESNTDGPNVQQNKSFKLTMLNDDCLEYIFKKLKLKEQVRFALTCQRFRNIFEMVCKTEYKTHRMEDLEPLTLWEIREFFLMSGRHIEAIIGAGIYKDHDRIVYFIGKFCPNIKSINFNSTQSECSSFLKFLGKFQNCTVLQLRDCSLRDNAIDALKQMPNLQSLSVPKNYELTGKYMDCLTTVTDLVLYGCASIQPTHFAAFIKSLKDLKSLDIRHCDNLQLSSLSIMLDHSHKLESLKISCSVESYEFITRLPKLKELELFPCATIPFSQQFFEELVKHKAYQLESLIIVAKNCVSIEHARQIARLANLKQLICPNNENLTDEYLHEFSNLKNLEEIVLKNCISITNEGLLQLVRSCTKLKRVYIQRCTRITDQFVSEVIKVLKSMQNQRGKEPCLFYVAESSISSDVKNDVEYIAAIGIVKLSFEATARLGIEEYDSIYQDRDSDNSVDSDDSVDYDGSYDSDDYDNPDDYDYFDGYEDYSDYEGYDSDEI